jgi:hypothetical protein
MRPRVRSPHSPSLWATASAILLLIGSPALAQDQGGERSKYGSVRLGPVYLSLRAPFTVGVDSNVYNTPEGTSDRSATIGPTLQAVLPVTRRARIKASGSIIPQYFHREASQRYTDLSGDVRGEVDVGPATLFGGIGGGRYRQRFTLEIDDRVQRHETRDALGATLHIGQRVALSGSQTRLEAIYDPEAVLDGQPISTSLDRRTTTRRAELSLPLTRKTSLVPFAEFIEDRFLSAPDTLKPSVRSERYGASLAFGELAFLNGTLSAGVRHFGQGEGVAQYDGLFLYINLSSPFVVGTRLFLSANRDVRYSALTAAAEGVRNTYVDSNYRADVVFELPLHLHGRVFGGYFETQYLLPLETDPVSASRREHGWLEGGALLRHFGRHLSIGVRAQHESRNSPVDGRSYGGVAYGLAGEVRF